MSLLANKTVRRAVRILSGAVFLLAVPCTIHAQPAGTITYVQGNSADPQSSQTSVNVTFMAAQAAGDLNVVVVRWNDSTATVNSATDSRGNTYTPAVGPTILSGVAWHLARVGCNRSGAHELYNSSQAGTRDALDVATKLYFRGGE